MKIKKYFESYLKCIQKKAQGEYIHSKLNIFILYLFPLIGFSFNTEIFKLLYSLFSLLGLNLLIATFKLLMKLKRKFKNINENKILFTILRGNYFCFIKTLTICFVCLSMSFLNIEFLQRLRMFLFLQMSIEMYFFSRLNRRVLTNVLRKIKYKSL